MRGDDSTVWSDYATHSLSWPSLLERYAAVTDAFAVGESSEKCEPEFARLSGVSIVFSKTNKHEQPRTEQPYCAWNWYG